MSIRTSANRMSAAIAVYLISDIFSLHDLRGPSANRDACYRSRPVARIAPDLSAERLRRGLGNLLLSLRAAGGGAFCPVRAIACPALSIRMCTSSSCTATTRRGSRRRSDKLYAPRLSALDRPARRRQNVRAASVALTRLERTILESSGVYVAASEGQPLEGRFTILSSVSIARRRLAEREQFTLFPVLTASEPGDARVTIGPAIRSEHRGRTHRHALRRPCLLTNPSPDGSIGCSRCPEEGMVTWRVPLASLAEQLPLTQRYPSHLQRVLQPAHEMLLAAGPPARCHLPAAEPRLARRLRARLAGGLSGLMFRWCPLCVIWEH